MTEPETEQPPAVAVRDAATVVLLRDGADGLEVWMLVRVREMAFAGGMAVFPGGRVEEADSALQFLEGDAVGRAAARFGCDDSTAHALLGAALREVFEETGVLMAELLMGEPPVDLSGQRAELEAGRRSFGDLLAAAGVVLDPNRLRPWARWVTPAGHARRYDTRFFVGTPPAGVEPQNVTSEATTAAWLPVAEALARGQRGELALLPPTLVTLTELARFDTVADVLYAADQRVIETVRPTLQQDADGRPFLVHNDVALPLPSRELR